MIKTMHRMHRKLGWALVGAWLLLSNAALCLAIPSVATPDADAHAHHAMQGASVAQGDMHAGHAGHAAVATPQAGPPAAHGCCDALAEYPCCGTSYVGSFDGPALANLALAPVPDDFHLALPLPAQPQLSSSLMLPRSQDGPRLYLLCCSFLI